MTKIETTDSLARETKLSFDKARAQYVHRFTMEHVPAWAGKQRDDGSYYAPQYRSDREWYNNTTFPPHSGDRNHCLTENQTWPLGKALDAPFKGGR